MASTTDDIEDVALQGAAALRRKASQLQKFFDDVEELLGRVSSLDDKDISRLRARVESSLDHVKDSVRGAAGSAIEGARYAARATDDHVHRKPWVAIGAAAAIGLLVGALIGRD